MRRLTASFRAHVNIVIIIVSHHRCDTMIRRFGADGGGEGRCWHIVAASRLQLVYSSCTKESWAKKLIFIACQYDVAYNVGISILSVHPSVERW